MLLKLLSRVEIVKVSLFRVLFFKLHLYCAMESTATKCHYHRLVWWKVRCFDRRGILKEMLLDTQMKSLYTAFCSFYFLLLSVQLCDETSYVYTLLEIPENPALYNWPIRNFAEMSHWSWNAYFWVKLRGLSLSISGGEGGGWIMYLSVFPALSKNVTFIGVKLIENIIFLTFISKNRWNMTVFHDKNIIHDIKKQ